MTAGASAPETVVQECVEFLSEHFAAAVQEVVIREEHVRFPLPRMLRESNAKV